MSTATLTLDERFARATRHSRMVRRLRWMLPALAAGACVLFMLSTLSIKGAPSLSMAGVNLQGTTLVMSMPHASGFDNNRRPYKFVAERARQDITTPKRVALDVLDARLELAANGWVRVTADTGFYNGDASSFRAEKNVHVMSSFGYEMFLEDADVDIKTNALQTNRPVEGRRGDNRIFADRMQVVHGGERVIFDGHVHVVAADSEPHQ